MLICPSCNNEQNTGKFCGKCGTALILKKEIENDDITSNQDDSLSSIDNKTTGGAHHSINDTAATTEQVQTAEPREQIDIKENVANFGAFFLMILKNPTQSLHLNESKFTYGIANAVLYILTFMLSIYFTLNTLYKSALGFFMGEGGNSLPFFSIASRLSISLLVILAASLAVMLLLLKLASKKALNFQEFIAQYGGIITPFVVINTVAILTGLSGSPVASFILLAISFIFALYIAPGFIVFEHESDGAHLNQKVYLSFGAILLGIFTTYLIVRTMIMNYLESVFEMLDYFM